MKDSTVSGITKFGDISYDMAEANEFEFQPGMVGQYPSDYYTKRNTGWKYHHIMVIPEQVAIAWVHHQFPDLEKYKSNGFLVDMITHEVIMNNLFLVMESGVYHQSGIAIYKHDFNTYIIQFERIVP